MNDRGTGRLVVITGGSRGIGAATARRLARDGWDVCITYLRDAAAAEAVVADCAAAGAKASAIRADVSVERDVLRVFEQAAGPLLGLVNNAGIVAPTSTVAEMSAARIRRVFDVNVLGAFLCAREAVARMATSRGGRGGAIVNVSSRAAALGSPGEYVDYAASKAALDALTLGLAKEVATDGIRVNSVRPGLIDTEIHARNGEPDRLARLAPTVPMRRAGTAEEVAAAVAWLLSDATFTTGSIIDVSGGR